MVAGDNNSKGNQGDKFFQCRTYAKRGKKHCHRNLFRESTAVEYIVDIIRERVLQPKTFDRLAKAIAKEAAKRQRREPAAIEVATGQRRQAGR